MNMDNFTYGITGLTNQGNTCYMNSIIQCLSNCKDFRNFLLNDKIIHLLNNSDNIYIAKNKLDNTLTFQLRKILSYFWFNNFKILELTSFRKIFCKKINIFRNFNQHDSQEALLCIIDTIHEELAQDYQIYPNNKDIVFDTLKYYYENNLDYNLLQIINEDISKYLNFKSFIDFKNTHKNYSNIYNIFEGRTISQLKCPITNGIKANFESQFYFTLSLINDEESSSEYNSSESNHNSSKENHNSSESNPNSSEENEIYSTKNSNSKDYTTSSESEYSNEDDNLDETYKKYKNLVNLNNYENESNNIFDSNYDKVKSEYINSDDNNSENGIENNSNDSENGIENNSNDSENETENNSNDSENEYIDYESNENDIDNENYLNLIRNSKKIKKYSIYELFDNFAKIEILDSDNQWFSPYCQKKVNAEKINLIWESPKVFIILIKRFEYTEYGAEKLNHLINFPINNLDITKYLHPHHVSKYTTYNLFAINNHDSMNSNGIDFGHYYSYCKNSIDNKWYNFDDDEVNEIDEDDLVTNKAYMLFYEASN